MDAIFINLSNHPINSWSEQQIEDLHTLGYNSLQELPGLMPLVEATASTSSVYSLALDILHKINLLNQTLNGKGMVKGAYVSGDYTLTYQLVTILETNNIRCYAATTKRLCEEKKLPDGSIQIMRLFSFVQWRPYIDRQ